MKLRICHLYPDVLNLYGDRGNIICLCRRLEWRGIEWEMASLRIGEQISWDDFDLFFMGGGQDFEQGVLLEDLRSGNGSGIKAAIEDGRTFLCICGGYQILGNYYETQDGQKMDFLGVIDLYTVGDRKRLIGNYAFRIPEDETGKETVAVGFENHSGRTFLGGGVQPLGYVLAGNGNNGKDHTEGVRFRNVFGTYSHGPLLPKNPELCDRILRCALERKYGSASLEPLEDSFERKAHDSVLKRVLGRH